MKDNAEKILTIAIPVYNTESFLSKCLDSVLNCEYNRELEIIIINDGSPDNSNALIEKYYKKYPHIIRYKKKENGGWGSCINLAITEATGLYFKILDSDDFFDVEALNRLIETLKSSDADLLMTSMSEIYSDGHINTICIPREGIDKIIPIREHFENMSQNYPLGMLCYKSAILQHNHITLSPRYYADIEFGLKPLPFLRTITYAPYNVYQYQKFREAASTSTRSYAVNRSNYITVAKNMVNYYILHKEKMSSELNNLFKKELINLSRGVYNLYLSTTYQFPDITCNISELRDFTKFLHLHSPETLRALHQIRKKGIPYIWIWNNFNINILNVRKLWM